MEWGGGVCVCVCVCVCGGLRCERRWERRRKCPVQRSGMCGGGNSSKGKLAS